MEKNQVDTKSKEIKKFSPIIVFNDHIDLEQSFSSLKVSCSGLIVESTHDIQFLQNIQFCIIHLFSSSIELFCLFFAYFFAIKIIHFCGHPEFIGSSQYVYQIKIITSLVYKLITTTLFAPNLLTPNYTQVFQLFILHSLIFSLKISKNNPMQSSQLLTPKRQHYNRFAYLLEPNSDKQKQKIQKEFNFFSINQCTQNVCKSQQQKSQAKEQQTMLSQPKIRIPLKYQLKSQNYDFFKRQIDQKHSLKSFLAYTPQKSQIKDQFSIYNDISTIQYTRSNQMHTHRNFVESILEEETEKIEMFESEEVDRSVRHFWRSQTENQEEVEQIVQAKLHENQLIKLELSQSDDQSKQLDSRIIKKHLRTMTQGNEYPSKNLMNLSTAQKSTRFNEFIRKSQFQSIEVSQPSKDDSMEYCSIQKALQGKDNKFTGATMASIKTKKMSQKLQESSEMEYNNSISISLKKSQLSCVLGSHKSIKLGRRALNKL